MVPDDVPFIKMAVTDARDLLKTLLSDPDNFDAEKPVAIKVIVFEKSEECIVVGSLPATIYRQVGLDSWDH